jgi:hypothetical protein
MMRNIGNHLPAIPIRTCSGCDGWVFADMYLPIEDGYLKAICTRADDPRNQEWKRGSDSCSRWSRRMKAAEL